MVIENRSVTTACCEACGRINYGEDGKLTTGYTVRIGDFEHGVEHIAYACRLTHIGKAARAVLAPVPAPERHDDGPDGDSGPLVPAAAPALPEDGSDSTAATP